MQVRRVVKEKVGGEISRLSSMGFQGRKKFRKVTQSKRMKEN